jgi:hypothetical protein
LKTTPTNPVDTHTSASFSSQAAGSRAPLQRPPLTATVIVPIVGVVSAAEVSAFVLTPSGALVGVLACVAVRARVGIVSATFAVTLENSPVVAVADDALHVSQSAGHSCCVSAPINSEVQSATGVLRHCGGSDAPEHVFELLSAAV